MHRNRSAFGLLFFFLVVVAPLCHTNADESAAATEEQTTINPETDWGSFYDPKNVFCGKYDCYKILGFDYFHWGDDPPSIKDITKSYRSLSRQWHPDKNKERGAREKFVVSASTVWQNHAWTHGGLTIDLCLYPYLPNANLVVSSTGHCQSLRSSNRLHQTHRI